MEQCKNGAPLCKYGKPYPNGILSCCEWCDLAVECFLIADRDYEGEFLAREEHAERLNKAIREGIQL